MKKFFKWLGIIILVLIIVLLIGKNLIIKSVIINGAKSALGMDVSIDSLGVGVFKTTVDLKGLVVENPDGFGGGTLIDVPEVLVDYVLKSFLKGNAYFTEIRLYIKEINVVQDREGKLNVEAFSKPKKEKRPRRKKEEKEVEEKAPPQFRIDLLKLKIDKATFTDMASGKTEVYDLGIDEEFENVTDSGDIIRIVMIAALQNNLFRRATGLDLNEFARQLGSEDLEGLSKELEEAGKGIGGIFKSIFGD